MCHTPDPLRGCDGNAFRTDKHTHKGSTKAHTHTFMLTGRQPVPTLMDSPERTTSVAYKQPYT